MAVEIQPVGVDALPRYAAIPIAFTVRSVLRVKLVAGGLGGLRLVHPVPGASRGCAVTGPAARFREQSMPFAAGKFAAISFDADGTLWDFQKAMRHALRLTLQELRRHVPSVPDSLDVEAMIAIRDQVAQELKGRVANLEDIRLAAFQRTLAQIHVDDDALAAHLHGVYLRHRFEDMELFADVLPTLDALQGRYGLGLVSNGNSYPERCGLAGRFQFVVLAQDHGTEKPDPRLFEIALAQAGCARGELLHVGDSLANDVAGATAAGIRSAWLNRQRAPNDTGIRPDLEIHSLTELAGLLGCQQDAGLG